MFIGHYAPALVLAAAPRAPRLGALFVAAQLVDIAFFLLVLLGVEHFRFVPGFTVTNALDLYDIRWSHSLLGTFGWAGLFALVVRLRGGSWETANLGAAVVASHWLLDLVVHAPDLTLIGAGPRLGLGLWNHPALAMPLELALAFTALAFYAGRTRARGWQGKASFALLAGMMATFQMVTWLSPQPTTTADPTTADLLLPLAAYAILAALAWWTDATRWPRATVRAPDLSHRG